VGTEEQLACPREGSYVAMIDAFSESILAHSPPPVSLADGIHLVQATAAVYRSVAERRVVRTDEVEN
jgi:hypothetical protein